jgi:azurin
MRNDMDVNNSRNAPIARRALFFVVFAVLLISFGCARNTKPVQRVVNLHIESDGDFLAFQPDTLTCPTGSLVHVEFHHMGKLISARHNWMLVQPGQLEAVTKDALKTDGDFSKDDPRVIAATPMCDRGATVTTEFVAPAPGDYPFLCSTHPEDMRGVLHVTK